MTDSCDRMDCSPPASSVHGISQTRILAWVPISFSRGSSRPRDRTCVSCIGRWILYHWTTWDVGRGEVGETQRGKLQAPLQAHREDSGCMKAPASFWKRIRCDKVLEPSALLKRSSVLSVKLRFWETRPMASAAARGSWGGGGGRPEVLRGLVPERKVQFSCVSPTAQRRFFHLVPPKLEGVENKSLQLLIASNTPSIKCPIWLTLTMTILPLLTAELCPPRFLGWTPNPPGPQNVTVFGHRAFKDVIKLKCSHEGGSLIQRGWKRNQDEDAGRGKTTGHRRRQAAVNQGERPQKKPTLLTPWSWTSSFQDCETMNFCGLSHSVNSFHKVALEK